MVGLRLYFYTGAVTEPYDILRLYFYTSAQWLSLTTFTFVFLYECARKKNENVLGVGIPPGFFWGEPKIMGWELFFAKFFSRFARKSGFVTFFDAYETYLSRKLWKRAPAGENLENLLPKLYKIIQSYTILKDESLKNSSSLRSRIYITLYFDILRILPSNIPR